MGDRPVESYTHDDNVAYEITEGDLPAGFVPGSFSYNPEDGFLVIAEMEAGVVGIKKEEMLLEVQTLSKTKRNGGIVFNGLDISTDADARSLLTGAKSGGKASRKMVGKGGRANLTKLQFEAMVTAVDDHIQGVFDRHYDLEELIDAATTLTELDAIDITGGW
tara:strand:+ start:5923 stop:6411 length:489 start_codon:yes stop_codon:yes gene_type:complete